jgi:hypothetical protein
VNNQVRVRPSLIAWVNSNVPSGKAILELGSGDGTTKELCERYDLYSVEHSPQWIGKYKSNYIPTRMVNGWYDPDDLVRLSPKNYELLIIDGPIGKDRANFIHFFHLFRDDVPIILDDSERVGEQVIVRFLHALGYVDVGGDKKLPTKQWVVMKPMRFV